MERATFWIEEMSKWGVQPTVSSYSTLIAHATRRGDIVEAERWLATMMEAGIDADLVTYNTVLSAYCKMDDRDRATDLVLRMRAQGITPFAAMVRYRMKYPTVTFLEAFAEELSAHEFSVDFGFACPVEGRDGSGINRSIVGSLGFMAPEIHAKQPYQAQVVDLFALGVILFIMYAGHPPFNMANMEDPHYKLIATNRSGQFWSAHSNRKAEGFFNEEFKDLVTAMLSFHPH